MELDINKVANLNINTVFTNIKTALSRNDLRIENKNNVLIILNEDNSDLSTEDQTTINNLYS